MSVKHNGRVESMQVNVDRMRELEQQVAALKEAIAKQGAPFGWYWNYRDEDGFIVNDGQDYDIQPDWIPLYTSAPKGDTP